MNPLREIQDIGELLIAITVVWIAIIGGGIGFFWLLGKVMGA